MHGIYLSVASDLIKTGLISLLSREKSDFSILDSREQADLEIVEVSEQWEPAGVSHSPNTLLLLTQPAEQIMVKQWTQAGVKGIVTMQCKSTEIVHAAKTVASGNRFFCSRVLDQLVNDAEPKPSALTDRETEILAMIAKGKTTSEIAHLLSISVHTVNSHRKNMLKKFGLKSPVQLVTYALEQQIIQPD